MDTAQLLDRLTRQSALGCQCQQLERTVSRLKARVLRLQKDLLYAKQQIYCYEVKRAGSWQWFS